MKDFAYYKQWAIELLKKKLKPESVEKSIYAAIQEYGEIIEKGKPANVGEIGTWNGKKYKKISPKKWIRYCDSHGRGSQQALRNAIREIENLKDGDVEGLLQIILKNKSRFSNDYGKPMPEVEELSKLAANKQADWNNESRNLADNIEKLLNGTDEEKEELKGSYFTIGYPTQKLKNLGLNGEKFTIKAGPITRKKNKNKEHNLTAQNWKDICLAINKPLIVAKSNNEKDKFRLFVNVKVHGRFVALGVDVINTRKGILINKVSSAYGRLNNNEYTIIDSEEKLTSEQATLLTSLSDSKESASNIKPAEADLNIPQTNNLSTTDKKAKNNPQKIVVQKSVAEEILSSLEKSHKYSRKEFKNGKYIYYYDKNNNHSRMTQCKSSLLKISKNANEKSIVNTALNYIHNVWEIDWKRNPNKAICKELNCRKITFSDISFDHLSVAGNRSRAAGKRNVKNLMRHIPYLPCAKELIEANGVHTESRYEPFINKQKDGAIGIVYQALSGIAPTGSKEPYISVTVSQRKYKDGTLSDTVYISVVGKNSIKKSLTLNKALCASPGQIVNEEASKLMPIPCKGASNPLHVSSIPQTNNLSTTDKNKYTNYIKSIEKSFNWENMRRLVII